MKKILSTLMAALLAAGSALAVSAGTFVYDESDGEYWDANMNMMDKSANHIWYTDGTASNHGIPKLNGEIAPNCDLNQTIDHGWYELVLCNLGSTPEMFPEEVDGKAAFIIRGTSTFTVKTENAMNAGAEVVFIGHNAVTGEQIDETGLVNGTYANVDSPSIEYETIPMGLFNTDMCVKMVAEAAGVSIAEAVAAVKAVGDGAADLGLAYKNPVWVFYGTEAEYKANATRTDANTITSGAAAAATEAPAAAPAEGEPVLTIDFAEGAGDVELVNAEIIKDSERGNVLKVNGVGTSQTGASYGLLKTDVFENTNWENGMTVNMWIKTDASDTLHGTAPIFSLDIANVGYIALTTSLESAINTDGNDTSLGIAPRIWTDPADVGNGVNATEEETWQFLSVVYNEDHIDLYVDGELYSDHPFANGNATDMTAMINLMIESEFVYSVRLGSWLCSWWKYGDYEGCIDDFTVYNKILSADEVKALYEATKDVEVPVEEAPVVEEAP
ncbi:MAG: hypothetical protein J6I42_06870, partial [Clostridia bacterium]|nr:hypothetical protein [Clostridia bacterium]